MQSAPATALPSTLLVLKDGHVGSEWFAETLARQPGTRFIFEMGPCITSSLEGKMVFFGSSRRGCACTKEDCALFRTRTGSSAPCLDAPSRTQCRVLGGSHMSVTSERELQQWEHVLQNHSSATVLVQTRSNLVKWAWSFYRTGAMKRLRGNVPQARRERIHLREEANRSRSSAVKVDPVVLLRMVIAKQERSERLVAAARRLARHTGVRRERVLLYEAMQADMAGELRRLYAAMHVPFDERAHANVPSGSLLKHAPEDLSRAIANWDELTTAFRAHPCLHAMLVDTRRRVFDDCGDGMGFVHPDTGAPRGDPTAPCACSWRTPIVDADGNKLDDAAAKALSQTLDVVRGAQNTAALSEAHAPPSDGDGARAAPPADRAHEPPSVAAAGPCPPSSGGALPWTRAALLFGAGVGVGAGVVQVWGRSPRI